MLLCVSPNILRFFAACALASATVVASSFACADAASGDCPAGFERRGMAWPHEGHCENGAGAVLGPFSRAMVKACAESNLSADTCEGPTWDRALYLTLRGSRPCAQGTEFDEATQRCREKRLSEEGSDSVFGPFSYAFISACVAAGGGSACLGNRWEATFSESLAATAPVSMPLSERNEVRGVYISNSELEKLDESGLRTLARRLLAANVNTAYLSVYVHGKAYWNSPTYRAAGGLADESERARLWGRIFRDEGLHPVAWFESGLLVGAPEHPIARAHPEWLQRDSTGSAIAGEMGSVFLSPGSTGARTFVVAMMEELAAPDMPFEEIQLDHFHWTFLSNGREPGYETPVAYAWQKLTGRAPPDNTSDPRWVAFREDLLQSLVRDAREAIKRARPAMRLTACPEAVYALTKHMKNWPNWLSAGIIDGVTLQIYYPDERLFLSQLRTLAQMARERGALGRFGVALDASQPADEAQVERQITLARSEGFFNVTLWAWHNYGAGISILDNLERQAKPGGVWSAPALQPFR